MAEAYPKTTRRPKSCFARPLSRAMPAHSYNLGVMYFTGRGVPQNDAEAVAWLRQAAEQGHANAQFNLGVMYFNGRGVPQDFTEAIAWHRQAAEPGVGSAQFNLGWMYDNCRGVPQDYSEAAALYRQAAEQGNSSAQFNLGLMYDNGRGVPQDNVEAHMWLNLTAAKSTGERREQAVAARDRVAAQMTPADMSEAQRRAREWHAAHPVPVITLFVYSRLAGGLGRSTSPKRQTSDRRADVGQPPTSRIGTRSDHTGRARGDGEAKTNSRAP